MEVDGIQRRLAAFAGSLTYQDLSPETIHAAKARLINTCGALLAGYFSDPGRALRRLAGCHPSGDSTVLGTRRKVPPDVAALINTSIAGYVEMGDTYHWPGSYHGHPSDVIMPLLALAEHARVGGRELMLAIVTAYEIYLRFSDVFHNEGFDYTTFGSFATAAAGARLLGLNEAQISHAISMAVTPNNILKQARRGQLSMFKSAAAGHAGRAGVFAALLAQAGMEGPHLPFEGKAGWCDHVARERFTLAEFGGKGSRLFRPELRMELESAATPSPPTPLPEGEGSFVPPADAGRFMESRFKILDTRIKNRSSSGPTISGILAAEKIAPLRNVSEVSQITVEAYQLVIERSATGERADPHTAESADHSLPYVIAATLLDGTVTRRSFDEAHLKNPHLRSLMAKMKIVENEEFTRAYDSAAVEHRIRVTVRTGDGQALVGESGGDEDDLSDNLSDRQIESKFLGIAEDVMAQARGRRLLDQLWKIESVTDVSEIPPQFAIV